MDQTKSKTLLLANILIALLTFGCGSLDDADLLGGTIKVNLAIQNPDSTATGTAKAVEISDDDFSISKAAAATLNYDTCSVSCTDGTTTNSKDSLVASGASKIELDMDCPTGLVTFEVTCKDPNKTSNKVDFGVFAKKTVNLSAGGTISIEGLFLNQATRSTGDCRYAKVAQDNDTQTKFICGFNSALTDAQKNTARCNVEFDTDDSMTSPATVDASSDGLLSSAGNPYIVMEGGINAPLCFRYNTSGVKQQKGTGSWQTDTEGNTFARCIFGVRQWKSVSTDRKFRYAASCSRDGSTYVLIPDSGVAKGDHSAPGDTDRTSLLTANTSCSVNADCESGFCAGDGLCGSVVLSVSTVASHAGSTAGFFDGNSTTGLFNTPTGICIAPNGERIYVADTSNNRIRYVNPTLSASNNNYTASPCGTATNGFVNGACATVARLDAPAYCVVASDNNTIYFTDRNNHAIRSVTLANTGNTLATVAGDGTAGFTNGDGTGCQFSTPQQITIDSSDNLYVADQGNHAIRKIVTATGTCSTFAGTGSAGSANGTGTSASFNTPTGIVIHPTGGFLYVLDSQNYAIRRINVANQAVTTLVSGAGSFTTSIRGINIDPWGTNLYVSDNNGLLTVNLTTNAVSTFAGSVSTSGDGVGGLTDARFNNLGPIIFTPSALKVYMPDQSNHEIKTIQ